MINPTTRSSDVLLSASLLQSEWSNERVVLVSLSLCARGTVTRLDPSVTLNTSGCFLFPENVMVFKKHELMAWILNWTKWSHYSWRNVWMCTIGSWGILRASLCLHWGEDPHRLKSSKYELSVEQVFLMLISRECDIFHVCTYVLGRLYISSV